MPINHKVQRRQKPNYLGIVFLLFCVIALFSLATAYAWQNIAEPMPEAPKPITIPSTAITVPPVTVNSSDNNVKQTSQNTQTGESALPSSGTPSVTVKESDNPLFVIEGAVPASERVRSEYFDDAVFIGDSISTGIQLYGVMENTEVLASTGLNLSQVSKKQVILDENGNKVTVIDALKKLSPSKVYIMFGSNELGFLDEKSFISYYSDFIDTINEIHPKAIIYVQSIPPVTQTRSKENSGMYSNQKIDTYNSALLKLTQEKKVAYVNIAETLKNSDGALSDDISANDGMHFKVQAYTKWFDYLKTHTVK